MMSKCFCKLIRSVSFLCISAMFVVAVLFTRAPLTQFPQSLISSVASRCSSDKYIILAIVDLHVIDMAFNLYESSLMHLGIDNFLFVGLDPVVCGLLSARASIPCFHYSNTSVAKSMFNSKEFLRKMAARNAVILDVLTAGFNVILTDLDVVFLRNPLPDLLDKVKIVDVAAMWDTDMYNAGFFAIKSTKNGLKLWKMTCALTSVDRKINDQIAFNQAIRSLLLVSGGGKVKTDGRLKIVKLDSFRYACGQQYFDLAGRWFPSEPIGCYGNSSAPCADVVHNNWIVSHEAKVYRFKEHLLWSYDKGGYYTSLSTQYLVYDNPARVTWSHKDKKSLLQQLDALTTALAIGRLLGRIVILPRFHCFHNTRLYSCPLNSFISIAVFDSQFVDLYRENSFLRHPKVPAKVHQNIVQSRYFTDLIEARNTSKPETVLQTEILKEFRSVSDRVLSVGPLCDVRVKFDASDEQSEFEATVKKAFKTSDYRQLRLLA